MSQQTLNCSYISYFLIEKYLVFNLSPMVFYESNSLTIKTKFKNKKQRKLDFGFLQLPL